MDFWLIVRLIKLISLLQEEPAGKLNNYFMSQPNTPQNQADENQTPVLDRGASGWVAFHRLAFIAAIGLITPILAFQGDSNSTDPTTESALDGTVVRPKPPKALTTDEYARKQLHLGKGAISKKKRRGNNLSEYAT